MTQETITIPKSEYEKLKADSMKIRLIDEAIHEEMSTKSIMKLQEMQKSFDFLNSKDEDIYALEDLKEVWKREQ